MHAVELLILDQNGTLLSPCVGVPLALRSTYSGSTAVSGQSMQSACDMQSDWANNAYMRNTATSPATSWFQLNFWRPASIAQAILVQRKGSASLVAYSTTGTYRLDLYAANGSVIGARSIYGSGGLITAQFAPFTAAMTLPDPTSVQQTDEGWKTRLVRYVRVLCGSSLLQIR